MIPKKKNQALDPRFSRIRTSILPTLPILIQKNNSYKNFDNLSVESQVQGDLIKLRKIHNSKIYKKGFQRLESSVPCGTSSFFLLYSIYKKDKTFSVPVPDSCIFSSNFESPVFVTSKPKLFFENFSEGTLEIKPKISELLMDSYSFYNRKSLPAGIIKYSNTRKRLLKVPEGIYENFPDLSNELVIQSFIPPKGLRATKYRVIISKSQTKVYIINNNIRFDEKNDLNVTAAQPLDQSDIINSALYYSKISSYINKITSENFPDISKMPQEKKEIFEIFKNDPTLPKKKTSAAYEFKAKDNEKYLTVTDLGKSQFYEGKLSGYTEIIEMTEYLREKINSFILTDKEITELALDYLQDTHGKWILLKLVYGLTSKIQKLKIVQSLKQKQFKDLNNNQFDDTYNYDRKSSVIKNLLNPLNIPQKIMEKSFEYHKKYYGFD